MYESHAGPGLWHKASLLTNMCRCLNTTQIIKRWNKSWVSPQLIPVTRIGGLEFGSPGSAVSNGKRVNNTDKNSAFMEHVFWLGGKIIGHIGQDKSHYCCSVAELCQTLWDPMNCSTPGFSVLHHLLELAQTHVHWVSDAVQASHPLLPPSFALSLSRYQGLLQWVSSSHQGPNYFIFNYSISPSNEYSGLISSRIDCFDFPAVQETLKSLLQHHNSKASARSLL